MFTRLIKGPLFYNWFFENIPKKSIRISTTFIKKYATERLIKYYGLKREGIDIDIIVRGNFADFVSGKSDISAIQLLKLLEKERFKIYRSKKQKSNFCIIDGQKLLIGYFNLDEESLFAENSMVAAIGTNDANLISNFNLHYLDVLDNCEKYPEISKEFEYKYKKFYKKFSTDTTDEFFKIISSQANDKEKFNSFSRNLIINKCEGSYIISPKNIPQYSNLEDGTFKIIEILKKNNSGMSFNEIGVGLTGSGKKDVAYKKYGENHSKLAELLDLVYITIDSPRKVFLTDLGKLFSRSDLNIKIKILHNQILRIPIIQDIIKNWSDANFNLIEYLNKFLAKSTAIRRTPNIKQLLAFLENTGLSGISKKLKKL